MLVGAERHPAGIRTAPDAAVHTRANVLYARLPDDAGVAKIALNSRRQTREIRLADRASGTGTRESLPTSRSHAARRLKGPWTRKPKTTPARMTRLASAPTLASVHDRGSQASTRRMEMAPSAHHQRGQAKRESAVARKRRPAASHRRPNSGEIGWVNSGSRRSGTLSRSRGDESGHE